jgi:hypothetical protein
MVPINFWRLVQDRVRSEVLESAATGGYGLQIWPRVTLYTCGEIVSKSIAPPYITNPTATFIQVSRSGKITADAGDSGGPVFLVSDAWGVVSGFLYRGGNPVTQDLIYEAEDKVEIALNVTVRTDPP